MIAEEKISRRALPHDITTIDFARARGEVALPAVFVFSSFHSNPGGSNENEAGTGPPRSCWIAR
ncbi:hypothetical protein XH88_30370 [Bradyrhizobium sp. CCBAU 51627]|nr:hypothetical protein [Bradyrhizobium sp. CCBAU 51627]